MESGNWTVFREYSFKGSNHSSIGKVVEKVIEANRRKSCTLRSMCESQFKWKFFPFQRVSNVGGKNQHCPCLSRSFDRQKNQRETNMKGESEHRM